MCKGKWAIYLCIKFLQKKQITELNDIREEQHRIKMIWRLQNKLFTCAEKVYHRTGIYALKFNNSASSRKINSFI